MDHFHSRIHGWCSPEQFDLYREVAHTFPRGSRIVEIGAWLGKSTSFMAIEMLNAKNALDFYVVDHWLGSSEHQYLKQLSTVYEDFTKNMEPVKELLKVIKKPSIEAAKDFEDNSLDFVFIDAEHTYEALLSDITAWLPKLKPGGILAGDDWDNDNWIDVSKAVNKLLKNVELRGRVWVYRVPTVNNFSFVEDNYLNLHINRDRTIADTLIIGLENNANSLKCVQRAKEYCDRVGQPSSFFWGYDGTDRKNIKTPEHLKNNTAMQMLKVMDTTLSIPEVCCFLSHIAAWVHCMTINKPVVILEHDALMLRPFTELTNSNILEYLGHLGELGNQLNSSDPVVVNTYIRCNQHIMKTHKKELMLPMMQMVNKNYLLVLGLHAYAIDPMMARRLYGYVLKHGLVNPADAIIEQHEFTLTQTGIYAVQALDSEETTTIGSNKNNKVQNRKYTYNIPGVGA